MFEVVVGAIGGAAFVAIGGVISFFYRRRLERRASSRLWRHYFYQARELLEGDAKGEREVGTWPQPPSPSEFRIMALWIDGTAWRKFAHAARETAQYESRFSARRYKPKDAAHLYVLIEQAREHIVHPADEESFEAERGDFYAEAKRIAGLP